MATLALLDLKGKGVSQYSLKHLILQSVLPNDVSLLLAFLSLLIMSSLRILAQAALLNNGV